MVGLAMFSTLFLGVVLAIFLTLGAVRGDAERGLLQPLLVRPVSRPTLLLARWLGAIAVSHAVRDRGLRNRRRDHRPHRRLVARPRRRAGDRARRRRRDRGGALAARLGLPHRDRERDRDLHGLRRRPRLRACSARSATRSTRTASSTGRRSSRGLRRSRRSTRTALREITADTIGLTGYLIQLGPFGGANTGGTAGAPLGLRLPASSSGSSPRSRSRAATSDHHALLRRLFANATRFFFSSERRRASCFAASRCSSRCSAR